jgi:multiple sugar transport system substrate-binding protein
MNRRHTVYDQRRMRPREWTHGTPRHARDGFVLLLAAVLAAASGCRAREDVVILQFWGLGREGEVVAELARDFERENPGIQVRVQQIPWTAAHEKLLTSHVGDASPDLAQLGNTWLSEFVALDALMPLDTFVARSETISPSGFFEGIWDTNVIDGQVYGVPWYVDTRLLFYRSDLLERAGFDRPPASWDGWLDALHKIKQQAGPGNYAILLPVNEWNVPVILAMQQGSPLLRDDGRYGAFTDSAFARAFEFYIDMFRTGLAPKFGLHEIANVHQEFDRGLIAMWITGPWNIGEFRRRLPAASQGNWGTAALPGPHGDASGISMAGGASIVLFRSSEHQAEAWKLLEFLARPEQQLRFFRLTGSLPARMEAWQDSALIGDQYARAFWEQLQRVEPLPKVPEWELIATKVMDYSERAARTGEPPGRVLEALNREVDRILEKRRWMMERKAERDTASQEGARARGDSGG